MPAIFDALTNQEGFPASSPKPAQLDGATGSTFTVSNTWTVDAIADSVATKCPIAGPLLQFVDQSGSDYETATATHQALWVLDLGHGNPLVAVAEAFEGTLGADLVAAEGVVNSMSFR